ncbi:hypothetical protein ACI78V_02410 [Geodermatophilus sp. SYSU D00742]
MGPSREPQRLLGVARSSDDEIPGGSSVTCRPLVDLDARLLEADRHRRQLRPLAGSDDHRTPDHVR